MIQYRLYDTVKDRGNCITAVETLATGFALYRVVHFV